MEFLKKHYEKIVLGVVLVGLVGVLVFMPFYIGNDKQQTADAISTIINNPSAKPLPDLDLSAQNVVAARLRSTYRLDLASTNRVFNPMDWQKTPDGNLVPVASHIGAQMVVITNISPLYLILQLDTVTTNELGARYAVKVEKQAAATPAKRRPSSRYVTHGDTKANDTFSLVSIKGPLENPEELTVKLVDSGEIVSFSHDKPYRRVEGYSVDFRYDPEKKTFRGRRVGDKVAFNGTDFLVDDVKENELVLQDLSNQKKTPLRFNP